MVTAYMKLQKLRIIVTYFNQIDYAISWVNKYFIGLLKIWFL